MTTEIAILNRQTIALAADSAVTTSEKIFQSASKIFSLSKVHPIAAMIYSSATFMGVPWETIIKVYRGHLGTRCFPRLRDYAEDFILFLQKHQSLTESYLDDRDYVVGLVEDGILFILNKCNNEVGDVIEKEGKISQLDASKITNKHIKDFYDFLSGRPDLKLRAEITEEDFISMYELDLIKIYTDYLAPIPGLETSADNFFTAAFDMCTKVDGMNGYSGIVIAGFGDDEVYPQVETYHIGGRVCGNVQKYRVKNECANITNVNSAQIIGFAQDDVIEMFMRGVHPVFYKTSLDAYGEMLDRTVDRLLDIFGISEKVKKEKHRDIDSLQNQAKEKLMEQIEAYAQEKFINPTMLVVDLLPPLEVAELAEAMINLTALERKISYKQESVGGPTDVALISKGDGFVWVKRKHYFNPELNHHFFKNYFRGCYEQGEEGFGQKNDGGGVC